MKAAVLTAIAALLVTAALAHAGGSNYGVSPDIAPAFTGQVSEWAVPTPEFARDPAIAHDGAVFIAVMHGNKIARFDPRSERFTEWELPLRAHPQGLLVDRNGTVWYTGNGTIGRLDPCTNDLKVVKLPSRGVGIRKMVVDAQGWLWYMGSHNGRLGRVN